MVRARLPPLAIFAIVAVWIAAGLALDHDAGIDRQRVVGVVTWAILLGLLAQSSRETRVQVAALVVIATAMEYTASPLFGIYTYRLGNVPAYVPPGHGLVYLAALSLGGALRGPALPRATLAVGALWALWGVTLSDRRDLFGAVLLACYAGFLRWGRAAGVFAVVFVLTSELELIGTGLGNWAWAHGPSVLALGNPPSGIAGGYGFLDAAAMATAAWWLRRPRAAPS